MLGMQKQENYKYTGLSPIFCHLNISKRLYNVYYF